MGTASSGENFQRTINAFCQQPRSEQRATSALLNRETDILLQHAWMGGHWSMKSVSAPAGGPDLIAEILCALMVVQWIDTLAIATLRTMVNIVN